MTGVTDGAAPFASPRALRRTFENGLAAMLAHDLLGVFILVLANASYEPAMYARLRAPLQSVYRRWCDRFDADDALAGTAAPDDVATFERLRAMGLDNLQTTRRRSAGPWELQFNPLRALRPPRMSDVVVDALARPFDPEGFHFDRPFLRREVLWEGALCGTPVRLLYNKFPFADLHGLLVPDPAAGLPQHLDAHWHDFAWTVCAALGESLPGFGLGYNAYGAYSSVNHLHLQSYLRDDAGYPVEHPRWRHNGGMQDYPLPIRRFDDQAQAARHIGALNAADRAYNLLYRPGRVYVGERALQGSYRHSAWTGGFAWSEVAGAVTLFDEALFERLGQADIEAEFAAAAPA